MILLHLLILLLQSVHFLVDQRTVRALTIAYAAHITLVVLLPQSRHRLGAFEGVARRFPIHLKMSCTRTLQPDVKVRLLWINVHVIIFGALL